MASLSAVLIVKNEGGNIGDCLATLDWAHEIVVMDGGSSDDTVEIARSLGARVFVNDDWRGYGLQRQRAQDQATGDWVLMIDADERVTPALRREIQSVVRTDDRSRVYALPRLPRCFGRFIRHGGWYPDYVVRLYPRDHAGYGDDLVHESARYGPDMTLVRLKGDLLHLTYRDLEHYLVKSAEYASAWATEQARSGRRTTLFEGLVHGFSCFVRMYLARAGFRDGGHGLLLALLSAHSTFAKYADLWTRQRARTSPK